MTILLVKYKSSKERIYIVFWGNLNMDISRKCTHTMHSSTCEMKVGQWVSSAAGNINLHQHDFDKHTKNHRDIQIICLQWQTNKFESFAYSWNLSSLQNKEQLLNNGIESSTLS